VMSVEPLTAPRPDSAKRDARRAVVFISYNGLLCPLGTSQILPYLERLNREWRVHILTFERPDRLANTGALREMEKRLAAQQLGWLRLNYHQKPSLPATTYDMISGVVALRRLMARSASAFFMPAATCRWKSPPMRRVRSLRSSTSAGFKPRNTSTPVRGSQAS